MQGGPSEAAIDAAVQLRNDWAWRGSSEELLHAAHDPALGLDRSVCLRDVVDKLDELGCVTFDGERADHEIEQEFTTESPSWHRRTTQGPGETPPECERPGRKPLI